jgi:hypothetical protein
MSQQPFNSDYGFSTTGNITGNYIFGNGSQITGVTVTGSSPVSTTGNVSGGNLIATGTVSASGNITANYFFGNGSQLTGLPATYGNANVVANLAALGSNPVLTTGNINAGNVITTGALQGGTGTQGIALRPWTGGGSYAALYSTAITPADGNYSILVNGTNTWLNAGASGSLFFRINNNTTPTAFTVSSNRATVGSIGTANSTAYSTQTLAVAGGGLGVVGDSYFSNTVGIGGQVSAAGNITAQNFIGNISITGNVTGTSANVQLVAGAYTWTFDNTGNITLPSAGDLVFNSNTTLTSISNGNITIDPNGTGQLVVTSSTPAAFGNTISATGTITSSGNTNATAFAVVGNGAASNVALGFFPTGNTPAEMAIRDYSTANSTMYFDTTTGSANTGGKFHFRSSNAFTILANVNQYGITLPTRPGFRVYGAGNTSGLSTTNNGTGILNANNWAVDYNQGSYLNSSTGYFTAPAAGLYQVNLVARCANNTAPASQAVVIKNYGSGNVNQVMWEIPANAAVNHFGVSTTSKLAVGDTLVLKVTQGNVTFDINDSWSVVYLG